MQILLAAIPNQVSYDAFTRIPAVDASGWTFFFSNDKQKASS